MASPGSVVGDRVRIAEAGMTAGLPPRPSSPSSVAPHARQGPELAALVSRLHRDLVALDTPLEPGDRINLRRAVEAAAPLCTADEVEELVTMVSRQLFGLGPLDALLADASVTEVMVNGPGPCFVERRGTIEQTSVVVDADTLRVVIERIVAPLGLRVDRTVPFVDARLADGSRVHVAVPPLALDGPYLTIRRFGDRPFELDDFAPPEAVELLADVVRRGASLVVSGGTGSGKTSLLNALGAHIGRTERVITIEDAAELALPLDHVVRLEARPANAEGIGEISIRTLVRNALRMRPDRIIVGEVRGAEALDMVQAMITGHDGSMSTCHANSPADALRRIEAMVLMSDVSLPLEVVRDHVRAAIEVIVQVERGSDGRRRVVEVFHVGSSQALWCAGAAPVVASGLHSVAGA